MSGDLPPGSTFAEYRIEGLAARGGMGSIYRAHQAGLGRDVALKLILAEVANSADFRARFMLESRLAASIDHPHVVPVFAAGEWEGQPYIAMQWIDGSDLKSILAGHGGLHPRRAVTIISQVAGALDAAHAKGLVHRDVKPGNILVRRLPEGDHAYLTDFGVARAAPGEVTGLTRTGYFVGTVGYLAPEQLRGERGDSRSDFYALGCVLYEAFTGRRPFQAPNEAAMHWAHLDSARPLVSDARPELGPRFDAVVAKAMAIDPAERYQSGAELARALREAERGAPVSATALPAPAAATVPAPPAAVAAGGPQAAPAPAAPTVRAPEAAPPTVPAPAAAAAPAGPATPPTAWPAAAAPPPGGPCSGPAGGGAAAAGQAVGGVAAAAPAGPEIGRAHV